MVKHSKNGLNASVKGSSEKLWTSGFVLGTLANFVSSCNYFMLMVVMTEFAIELYNAPDFLAGLAASIFIIGTLFARISNAFLIEHFKVKTLLFIAAFGEIAFSLSYIIYVPIAGLLCLRFLHGFCFGVFSTTMATYITETVPPTRKGEGIGYYMLSSTLGAAVGPFIGIRISRYFSFNDLFFWAAALVILSIPLLLFLKTFHADVSGQTASEAAEEVVSGIEIGSNAEAKKEFAAEKELIAAQRAKDRDECSEHERVNSSRFISKKVDTRSIAAKHKANRKKARHRHHERQHHVIDRATVPIGIVTCLIFFGYSAILSYLTPFADEVGLTRAASVYFIAYALSMFITRPLSGRAFDRKGAVPVMTPAFISFSAGMVMLAFSTNDWLLLTSALLCGYGVGTVQSCGLSMAVKKAPMKELPATNATFYMMNDIGVGLGPVLLGLVTPFIGYAYMYLCMGALGLIALVFFFIVSPRYK